jgi:hypothetical protein
MRSRTILCIGLASAAVIVAAGGIALNRIDLSPYFKSAVIEKVAQATGRTLAVGGELKLTILPAPALIVKDVTFPNPDWAAGPHMVKVGEVSAQVALLPLLFDGTLHIDRLVLKDVDVRLATDVNGRGNWQFGRPEQSAASPPASAPGGGGALALPSFNEIRMENIAITYDDARTRMTTAVSFTTLSISGSSTGPLKVKASAAYQDLPIEVNATLGALSSLTTPGQPYTIDATIGVAGATAKLLGSVAEPLAGRGLDFAVSLDGHDLGMVGTLLDIPVPDKPYHVTATVTGDVDGIIAVKALKAAIGASALSGEASLAVRGVRPKLSATLSASMIDLTELLRRKATATARSGGDDRVFDTDPLPLAALKTADADISLNAKAVKSTVVTLQDLSVRLMLDDGTLRVEPFAFDLGGGHVGGNADLSTRQAPAGLAINLDARHLDFGKLLAQISGSDILAGRGDLAVAAHGSGGSVRAIMASLDGTSSLVIGRGVIKNRYADLVGADVFREAFAWTQGKQDSKLTCMVSRFDIRNGVATSRDLLIDTDDVTIVGEGKVNLGSERLDLELTPRPKESSLLNLAVPIDIGGTFKQPTIRPNRMAMAKDVAKGVVTWINPLFALLPMVLDSGEDKNPCYAAIQMSKGGTQRKDATQRGPAPKKDEGGVAGVVNGLGRSIGDIFK